MDAGVTAFGHIEGAEHAFASAKESAVATFPPAADPGPA
jgi:hypothetical protein